MTRLTVHEYAAALRPRYRAARKGGKGEILDEFCQTTGLHRKAAIRLLGKATGPVPARRGRPRRYGPEVAQALVKLWEVGDRMCGRLLACCDPRFYWGSRNRAMILVLLDTGVRRTELVSLDLADLDLEGQRLRGAAREREQAAGGAVRH